MATKMRMEPAMVGWKPGGGFVSTRGSSGGGGSGSGAYHDMQYRPERDGRNPVGFGSSAWIGLKDWFPARGSGGGSIPTQDAEYRPERVARLPGKRPGGIGSGDSGVFQQRDGIKDWFPALGFGSGGSGLTKEYPVVRGSGGSGSGDLTTGSGSSSSTAYASSGAFGDTQFSPGAFADTQFSPGAFADTQFSPGAFADTQFSPGAFADTQYRPERGSGMTKVYPVVRGSGSGDDGFFLPGPGFGSPSNRPNNAPPAQTPINYEGDLEPIVPDQVYRPETLIKVGGWEPGKLTPEQRDENAKRKLIQAYIDAEKYMPRDDVYTPYQGPINTAREYGGPSGSDWVERFDPSTLDRNLTNQYRELIGNELGRDPYDTADRRDQEGRRGAVATGQQFDLAERQRQRELLSMGINPASGAFDAESGRGSIARALATSGAENQAREDVRLAGIADRDRRLQIGGLGADIEDRDRARSLDEYRATQEQRQFGATLAISAWEIHQRNLGLDADRQLSQYEIEKGIQGRDADRRQAERQAWLESLGALHGDNANVGGGGGGGFEVKWPDKDTGKGGSKIRVGSDDTPDPEKPKTGGGGTRVYPDDPYGVDTYDPVPGGSSGSSGGSSAPSKSPRPRTRPTPNPWKGPSFQPIGTGSGAAI